jgi:hypothetical protein
MHNHAVNVGLHCVQPNLPTADNDVMRDIYAMIEKFAVTQSIKRNVLLKKATLSHRQ